jgi:DNA-binding CsgD family transcriptional regulator
MSPLPNQAHPYVFRILARLDQLEVLRDALESALDWLPTGYLLVDREGRVLKANRVARAMIRRCDGLRMRGGMLEASDGQAAAVLCEAIRRASAGPVQSTAAFSSIVHISRARARPLTMILVPIQRARHSLHPGALVVLLIPGGEVGRQKSGPLLRELYGLTQREADIASNVLQGHSVGNIARQRGLSVNTVRTHLKHLLEKTRTTRQVDLLRVLVASFPPVSINR